MSLLLYMDVHVPRVITLGLRVRMVDVLTAQEDGSNTVSDPELLDRATQLRRLLFAFDDDLLSEATKRQRENKPFSGVIYGHPMRISIGQCIKDLELLTKAGNLEALQDRVVFLPLK